MRRLLVQIMETIINVDLSTMPDLIHILIRDEATFNALKSDFPDILADLTTLKTNANCSCRGKVGKFFSDKVAATPGLLEKYYKDKQAIARELEVIKQRRIDSVIGGKVFKVQLGDDAWRDFNKTIVGKTFRSFSVVREFDYLMVYFL